MLTHVMIDSIFDYLPTCLPDQDGLQMFENTYTILVLAINIFT